MRSSRPEACVDRNNRSTSSERDGDGIFDHHLSEGRETGKAPEFRTITRKRSRKSTLIPVYLDNMNRILPAEWFFRCRCLARDPAPIWIEEGEMKEAF